MFKQLILASASPRRKELLAQVGIDALVFPADIDESVASGESPEVYVDRMARRKALAAAQKLAGTATGQRFIQQHAISTPCCILASDTCGVIDVGTTGHAILGKPENFRHFQSMMRDMSDRTHQVLTSVYVLRVSDCWPAFVARQDTQLDLNAVALRGITVATTVRFKHLSESEIENYWATGEPQDKAGGYGIQGKGALLVAGIEGSYSNVVGLPLLETQALLAQQHFPTWLIRQFQD